MGNRFEEEVMNVPMFDVEIPGENYIRNRRYDNITSNNSIVQIANIVTARFRRQLTETEFKSIRNAARATNPAQYEGKTDNQVRILIANNFVNARQISMQNMPPIDIHETLKLTIGNTQEMSSGTPYRFAKTTFPAKTSDDVGQSTGVLGGIPAAKTVNTQQVNGAAPMSKSIVEISNSRETTYEAFDELLNIVGVENVHDLINVINPSAHDSHAYMYLDSRYRKLSELSTQNIVRFTWDTSESADVQEGGVNYLPPLRDITEMEVSEFFIPYVSTADTQYRRVSLLIDEFQSQSTICHEKRRWHFLFETTIQGNRIHLRPLGRPERAQFLMDNPMTVMERITISFGAPLTPIIFDPDRLDCTVTFGVNPMIITTIGAVNHNLQNGDLIYFTDFTTLTPDVNTVIIAAINQVNGHAITVTGASTFTIPISLVGVLPPANNIFTIYFGSKRIEIPITFKFIRASTHDPLDY